MLGRHWVGVFLLFGLSDFLFGGKSKRRGGKKLNGKREEILCWLLQESDRGQSGVCGFVTCAYVDLGVWL